MIKPLKFLYETTINKTIEVKETKKDEKDPTVEITKTVKKPVPTKVSIAKPTRKLFDGAETFYAKKVADFIREGLLPFSLVQKRYANDGGALSEPEKQLMDGLRKQVEECKVEYFAIDADDKSEEANNKRNLLLIKINDVNTKLNTIENAYSDIFDNTAEVKARNKTLDWWVLHLSYFDIDGAGYKCIFGDGTYEEKLDVYETIDDANDSFTLESIALCNYLINFWVTARTNLNREELAKIDFKSMENVYNESLSTYRTEEPEGEIEESKEDPKKEESPVPTPAAPVAVKTDNPA